MPVPGSECKQDALLLLAALNISNVRASDFSSLLLFHPKVPVGSRRLVSGSNNAKQPDRDGLQDMEARLKKKNG